MSYTCVSLSSPTHVFNRCSPSPLCQIILSVSVSVPAFISVHSSVSFCRDTDIVKVFLLQVELSVFVLLTVGLIFWRWPGLSEQTLFTFYPRCPDSALFSLACLSVRALHNPQDLCDSSGWQHLWIQTSTWHNLKSCCSFICVHFHSFNCWLYCFYGLID